MNAELEPRQNRKILVYPKRFKWFVEGKFPRRALSALLEWYQLYLEELKEDWELARAHEPLKLIKPLE